MQREEIHGLVMDFFTERIPGVTEDSVIGGILIEDEKLAIALSATVPVHVITAHRGTTVKELIANMERTWDNMPGWERVLHSNVASSKTKPSL